MKQQKQQQKAKTDTTQKANNPPHDPLADARNRAQVNYFKPKTPNMTPKASNDDAEPLHANENAVSNPCKYTDDQEA